MDILCVGICLTTLMLILITCELLNKRPQERIRKEKPGNCSLNALYACDAECPEGLIICCMSCNNREECGNACEDYNGACDARRLIYGKHQG